jgi:threonine/homoserine/homoserine lactone efflux protein
MELIALYVKALGVGTAVAAPVGPMSVLCMRRTLAQGWPFGLATGLGIATGDGAYALVAALGLAGVARFMLAHDQPLHLTAGFVLLYLGLRTFFAPAEAVTATGGGWMRSCRPAYTSAVLLTLTNPPTIVMFAAVFTALAPRSGFDPRMALVTVAGVFSGSMLWWILMTAGITAFRRAIGTGVRTWIDRIAGAALGFFGVSELRRVS